MQEYRLVPDLSQCGVPGDVWRTLYHGTRRRYVEAILRDGLRTGGIAHGILPPQRPGPADEFYGRRPVFLALGPSVPRDSYEWEDWDGDEPPETPVMLEVDGRGLLLLPDLEHLRWPGGACLDYDGIYWYDPYETMPKLPPDRVPGRTPPELRPFQDDTGFIPWSVLMTDAAKAAIELTGTAAVLSDIEADRICVSPPA
jgi:hypothetical protein